MSEKTNVQKMKNCLGEKNIHLIDVFADKLANEELVAGEILKSLQQISEGNFTFDEERD